MNIISSITAYHSVCSVCEVCEVYYTLYYQQYSNINTSNDYRVWSIPVYTVDMRLNIMIIVSVTAYIVCTQKEVLINSYTYKKGYIY